MRKIGLELRSLMNMIVRYTHKLSAEEEMSMQQAAIIKYLVNNSNRDINSKDLEEVFSMRRSTCSRMLKLMENRNLVERLDDPSDSRKKIIKPTKKSNDIISSIENKFDEMDDVISKNISEEDLNTFFSVLDQIKININDKKEEE